MLLKKKNILEYINDDIEISSDDSNREYSSGENFDAENFNEGN